MHQVVQMTFNNSHDALHPISAHAWSNLAYTQIIMSQFQFYSALLLFLK